MKIALMWAIALLVIIGLATVDYHHYQATAADASTAITTDVPVTVDVVPAGTTPQKVSITGGGGGCANGSCANGQCTLGVNRTRTITREANREVQATANSEFRSGGARVSRFASTPIKAMRGIFHRRR